MLSSIRRILDHYPALGTIRQIESLENAGGFSGSRIWRLETDAGSLCLRQWPREHPSAEQLTFIHRVLAYFASVGLTCLPVPRRTRQKTTFVEYEGHFWELGPWLPGKADYHTIPNRERLASAMTTLARLHLASASLGWCLQFSPTLLSRREKLRVLLSGGAEQLEAVVQPHENTPIGQRGTRLLAQFRRLGPQTAGLVESVAGMKSPLFPVIRDLWHDHLLYTHDEVSGIVDFGAMRVDSPACDLARLLGSLLADDQAAWKFALATYSAVRPLSADELRLVRVFDEANLLLAGLNWLQWLCVEGRTFEDESAILRRLDETLARLEQRR